MAEVLQSLPTGILVGMLGILALVVVILPVSLRLAGLTGQQIVDVLTLTMQFLVNLVREFRAQNKASP